MAKGSDAGSQRFHKREQREQDYKAQLPGEDEKSLPPPVDPIQVGDKPSRNEPCTCGSGKKYKKCCGQTKR